MQCVWYEYNAFFSLKKKKEKSCMIMKNEHLNFIFIGEDKENGSPTFFWVTNFFSIYFIFFSLLFFFLHSFFHFFTTIFWLTFWFFLKKSLLLSLSLSLFFFLFLFLIPLISHSLGSTVSILNDVYLF